MVRHSGRSAPPSSMCTVKGFRGTSRHAKRPRSSTRNGTTVPVVTSIPATLRTGQVRPRTWHDHRETGVTSRSTEIPRRQKLSRQPPLASAQRPSSKAPVPSIRGIGALVATRLDPAVSADRTTPVEMGLDSRDQIRGMRLRSRPRCQAKVRVLATHRQVSAALPVGFSTQSTNPLRRYQELPRALGDRREFWLSSDRCCRWAFRVFRISPGTRAADRPAGAIAAASSPFWEAGERAPDEHVTRIDERRQVRCRRLAETVALRRLNVVDGDHAAGEPLDSHRLPTGRCGQPCAHTLGLLDPVQILGEAQPDGLRNVGSVGVAESEASGDVPHRGQKNDRRAKPSTARRLSRHRVRVPRRGVRRQVRSFPCPTPPTWAPVCARVANQRRHTSDDPVSRTPTAIPRARSTVLT